LCYELIISYALFEIERNEKEIKRRKEKNSKNEVIFLFISKNEINLNEEKEHENFLVELIIYFLKMKYYLKINCLKIICKLIFLKKFI